jgi:hypothetical protein
MATGQRESSGSDIKFRQARALTLRRRIRWLVGFFMAGLVLSGLTAIPLNWEVSVLAVWCEKRQSDAVQPPPALVEWLAKVRTALQDVEAKHPFLAYGTDWLAFGHLVIALVFIGVLLDPLRNQWLLTFGLLACGLVLPWAWLFGALRGIPVCWRMVDCAFGIVGFLPLWLARRSAKELEELERASWQEAITASGH